VKFRHPGYEPDSSRNGVTEIFARIWIEQALDTPVSDSSLHPDFDGLSWILLRFEVLGNGISRIVLHGTYAQFVFDFPTPVASTITGFAVK
jgi:hypothetical protein